MENRITTSYYVYSGMVDWVQHEDLYPEDLPSDWRLAFYATQFRCVYLPEAKWRQASDQTLSAWLNDTREEFQFVLEAPKQREAALLVQVSRFGGRGVLDTDIDLRWLDDRKPDLRHLSWIMQSAVKMGRPVYLLGRHASLAFMRQVNELMDVLGV